MQVAVRGTKRLITKAELVSSRCAQRVISMTGTSLLSRCIEPYKRHQRLGRPRQAGALSLGGHCDVDVLGTSTSVFEALSACRSCLAEVGRVEVMTAPMRCCLPSALARIPLPEAIDELKLLWQLKLQGPSHLSTQNKPRHQSTPDCSSIANHQKLVWYSFMFHGSPAYLLRRRGIYFPSFGPTLARGGQRRSIPSGHRLPPTTMGQVPPPRCQSMFRVSQNKNLCFCQMLHAVKPSNS